MERVQDKLRTDQRFEVAPFPKGKMVQPNVHRPEQRNKWLNTTGFKDSAKQNALSPMKKRPTIEAMLLDDQSHFVQQDEKDPFKDRAQHPDFVRTSATYLAEKNRI